MMENEFLILANWHRFYDVGSTVRAFNSAYVQQIGSTPKA